MNARPHHGKTRRDGLYLREIALMREKVASFDEYPFRLPAVRSLDQITFVKPVTFIVGENGTGKSTLMEAIAVAWGFNPEGGTMNFTFSTHASHSPLYDYLRLTRGPARPKDGFFFRAESYYNLASNIEEMDREEGLGAKIIDSYGGVSLHEQSHGESFFAAFVHRFGGNGLYVLDEPEAALSPLRQMSLLTRIHELVKQNSQFIVATHSPIIMAYPGAQILSLNAEGMRPVSLEETDHYVIMKQFVNHPEKMLRELLDGYEG